MAGRRGGVPRPIRSTEYTIVFGTRGARIWFTVDVDDRVVCITDVHTHHPNQTK